MLIKKVQTLLHIFLTLFCIHEAMESGINYDLFNFERGFGEKPNSVTPTPAPPPQKNCCVICLLAAFVPVNCPFSAPLQFLGPPHPPPPPVIAIVSVCGGG